MYSIYDIDKKIRDMFIPILKTYELTVPDILAIAKYRIDGDICRRVVMRAIYMQAKNVRVYYAPYTDMWKPHPRRRKPRTEYVNNLPKIIRNLIMIEHRNVLENKKWWKRHHLYREYIKEMI